MPVMPASMDGTDPATWDPKLDGPIAAPAHHHILYEDENIRVISVSIAPGHTEPLHHHRSPSVFVIDSLPKLRDFNGKGEEIALPIPEKFDPPLVVKLPPQPPHFVRNEGKFAFHGTRVEFKKGYPDQG